MRSELLVFGENIYSQAGEDGILAEVFRRMGVVAGTYVDIGAHDGRFMSNTERLRECGWTGLNVDEHSGRCDAAVRNLERYPQNPVLCEAVSADNAGALTDWGVDFVSMDVDGPEILIWRAMPSLPKVVLIEIDPLDRLGAMREHSSQKRLSSFSSMVACGESKGYRMISYTGLNCLFALDSIAKDVLGDVPDADSFYLDGASRSHYRSLVKIRSDARAQLRDWSLAYC